MQRSTVQQKCHSAELGGNFRSRQFVFWRLSNSFLFFNFSCSWDRPRDVLDLLGRLRCPAETRNSWGRRATKNQEIGCILWKTHAEPFARGSGGCLKYPHINRLWCDRLASRVCLGRGKVLCPGRSGEKSGSPAGFRLPQSIMKWRIKSVVLLGFHLKMPCAKTYFYFLAFCILSAFRKIKRVINP